MASNLLCELGLKADGNGGNLAVVLQDQRAMVSHAGIDELGVGPKPPDQGDEAFVTDGDFAAVLHGAEVSSGSPVQLTSREGSGWTAQLGSAISGSATTTIKASSGASMASWMGSDIGGRDLNKATARWNVLAVAIYWLDLARLNPNRHVVDLTAGECLREVCA